MQKHQQKDYTQPIDLYQQALAKRPKNAGVWSNLAGAYYAREDYPKLKKLIKKHLSLILKGKSTTFT